MAYGQSPWNIGASLLNGYMQGRQQRQQRDDQQAAQAQAKAQQDWEHFDQTTKNYLTSIDRLPEGQKPSAKDIHDQLQSIGKLFNQPKEYADAYYVQPTPAGATAQPAAPAPAPVTSPAQPQTPPSATAGGPST